MLEYIYYVVIFPLEWIIQTVLEWGYAHIGSYGLSLILVSFVVNILLLPLYHIAETWQDAERTIVARMAGMTAQIKRVFHGKERYMLLRELYRQHHYHPIMAVRTSVGVLIQIPFFFAAFHLLSNYAPMQGASFGPIADLGKPDALFFGLNVLPFLMTAVNLISASVYTTRLSRRDKIQLYGMAALFLVLLYSSPAGLVFYWTWNNIFSLIKNAVYEKLGVFGHGQETGKNLGHEWHARASALGERVHAKLNTVQVGVFSLSAGLLGVGGLMFLREYVVRHHDYSLAIGAVLVGMAFLFAAWHIGTGRRNTKFTLPRAAGIVAGAALLAYICVKYGFYRPDITKFALGAMALAAAAICGLSPAWLERLDVPQKKSLVLKALALMALTAFIYSPLQLIRADSEFQNAAIFALLTWGVILGIGLPYALWKSAPRRVQIFLGYACAFAALTGTVYTFFLMKDYGVLDHFFFEREGQLFKNSNMFIDGIVVGAMATVVALFFYKKKLIGNVLSIAIIGTLAFCGMSCGVLLVGSADKPEDVLVRNDETYIHLSKNSTNVLVFMLDMFTGDHIDKMMRERPEVLNGFDGFTWYPDTVSAGFATVMSVPSIIAGEKIASYNLTEDDGKSLEEKIDGELRAFFEEMRKNVYEAKILACTDIDFVQDQDYVTHSLRERLVQYPDDGSKNWYNGLLSLMYGCFQASPWSVRRILYNDGTWGGLGNHSISWTENLYVALEKLPEITAADSKTSNYTFFINELTHLPWYIHSQTLKPMKGDPCPETTHLLEMLDDVIPEHYYAEQAALNLLSGYFNWLKSKQVYDNTCIIVVSDHGAGDSQPLSATFGNAAPKRAFMTYPGRPCALLMVKPLRAHGEIRVSNAEMSTTDVRGIAEATANGETWSEPKGDRVRYHAVGSWGRKWNKKNHYQLDQLWKITGPKLKRESWVQVK